MRALAVLLVGLCLAGCTLIPADPGYKGADTGLLVFGCGNLNEPTGIQLPYREVRPDGTRSGPVGRIEDEVGDAFGPPSEFAPPEAGQVHIHHLKPGNYEIYWYRISWQEVMAAAIVTAREEFSLPFTVSAGKATYIGDYATAYVTPRDDLETQSADGRYILVSDKHERDLEIARKRLPPSTEVTVSIPDVRSAHIPFVRADEIK